MGLKLRIDAPAYIWLCLGIMLLPLNWLVAALAAAAVHELCHLGVVKLLGIQIYGLRIGTGGCLLETEPMELHQELVCAGAGPLGSLLLLFLIRWFPRLAVCGAVQGIYNCLPLYPLDGGRLLHCAAKMLLRGEWAEALCRWTERLTVILLSVAAVWVSVYAKWGILSIAAAVLLAIRIGKSKNSLQTGATQGTIELPFLKR